MRHLCVGLLVGVLSVLSPVGAQGLIPEEPSASGSVEGRVAMSAIVDGSHTFTCLVATAWRDDGSRWVEAGTSAVAMGGTYAIHGLRAGAHRVGFTDTCERGPGRVPIATQFHPDALELRRAQDVTVAEGAATQVAPTSLSPSGTLAGDLVVETGKARPAAVDGLRVSLHRHDGSAWRVVADTRTSDGGYRFELIPAGAYRVGFARGDKTYRTTFHARALTLATATTVDVPAGDADDHVHLGGNRTWRKDAKVAVTSAPVLRGKARVGRTLRVTRGAYDQQGVTIRRQWQVKHKGGFRAVKGATRATYRLKARDAGARVRVRVVVRAPGYEARTIHTRWSVPVRRR